MPPRGLSRNEFPATLLGAPDVAWTTCIDGAVTDKVTLPLFWLNPPIKHVADARAVTAAAVDKAQAEGPYLKTNVMANGSTKLDSRTFSLIQLFVGITTLDTQRATRPVLSGDW